MSTWHSARSVVGGRFINCYSSSDWLLALLYRSKSYDMSIAGLGPVHLKDSTHIHPHSATTPISNTSACNKDVDDDNLHKKEGNESSKVPSSSTAEKERIYIYSNSELLGEPNNNRETKI